MAKTPTAMHPQKIKLNFLCIPRRPDGSLFPQLMEKLGQRTKLCKSIVATFQTLSAEHSGVGEEMQRGFELLCVSAGCVPNVACPSRGRGTTNRGKGPAVPCAGVRRHVPLHYSEQSAWNKGWAEWRRPVTAVLFLPPASSKRKEHPMIRFRKVTSRLLAVYFRSSRYNRLHFEAASFQKVQIKNSAREKAAEIKS